MLGLNGILGVTPRPAAAGKAKMTMTAKRALKMRWRIAMAAPVPWANACTDLPRPTPAMRVRRISNDYVEVNER